MGLFNAITNHTYATFKDTVTGLTRRELTEPLTNYNVVVADKQWKNNSSVYLINTNVTRGGGFNDADVVGAGFNLMNKKNTYGAEGASGGDHGGHCLHPGGAGAVPRHGA